MVSSCELHVGGAEKGGTLGWAGMKLYNIQT